MDITLPDFEAIDPKNIVEDLTALLASSKSTVDTLLEAHAGNYTYDNLLYPLEALDDALQKFWSPVAHLHAVKDTPALREAYNACLPLLSDYSTALSHNVALYEAIQSIRDHDTFDDLSRAQQQSVDNSLRDFRLAGVALSEADKQTYAALSKKMSQLTAKFGEQVLDATQAWTHEASEEELEGLTDHALAFAKQQALQRDKTGYLFTLDAPSYLAVMQHAKSRAFRQMMYDAFTTRASDQGPDAHTYDNSPVMVDIVKTRHAMATLLGFDTYADESLATKMADSPAEVLDLLDRLKDASHAQAEAEYAALCDYAKQLDGLDALAPWDVAYYSERLRQDKYAVSQEDLRPYFPEPQVLSGLFAIVKDLFGVRVEPAQLKTWHADVKSFALYDADDQLRAYCYMDLYARENKRGGAWMDDCQGKRLLSTGDVQIPVAYVTCNFSSPIGDQPALFTHDEVETLFHEFGHALQHMLTTVTVLDVAGINGIPWDAVELASQFMEYYCWDRSCIARLSSHVASGEPLPDDLFEKMTRAKHFHAAMQMMRQLEFALFDFRLHSLRDVDDLTPAQVQSLLDTVRAEVCVTPIAPHNRFQCGFTHIFAGGYAAGYYSYKWAEVMAADAYSLFDARGLFDQATAKSYLACILEPGGSESPSVLFERFRGRQPDVAALLKYTGIA